MNKVYSGFCFIESPNISGKVPSNVDMEKSDYIKYQLDAIEKFMLFANNNNYKPISLGGIFTSYESYEFVIPLINLMKKFNNKLTVLPSNKDMYRGKLRGDDPLAILAATGAVEIVSDKGWIGQANIKGSITGLYGVPSGHDMPKGVRKPSGIDSAALVFSEKPKKVEVGHLFRGVSNVVTPSINADADDNYWCQTSPFQIKSDDDTLMTLCISDDGINEDPIFTDTFLNFKLDFDNKELNSTLEKSNFVELLKSSEEDSVSLFNNQIDNELNKLNESSEFSDESKQIVQNLYKEIIKEENDDLGL